MVMSARLHAHRSRKIRFGAARMKTKALVGSLAQILIAVNCLTQVLGANSMRDAVDDNGNRNPLGREVGASAADARADLLAGCPQVPGVSTFSGRAYVKFVSPDGSAASVDVDLAPGCETRASDELVSAGFDLGKPTLLYSHGWQETSERGWMQTIRERYATHYPAPAVEKPFNLLQFDWSQASHLMYPQAVLSAPLLGKWLGSFLNALSHRYNYTMDNVHLIGFSLSTHIMGATGNELKRAGNVARQITALDSAGPCFYTSSPFALANTLRPDAAQLVVARHYGDDKYGARAPIGGLDIYVNGGKNQPSVPTGGGRSRGKRDVLDAAGLRDHLATVLHEYNIVGERATDERTCQSVAYRCDSYDRFLRGACARCDSPADCVHLSPFEQAERRPDEGVTRRRTRMFIQTGPGARCLHHYQVVIEPKASASANTLDALGSGRARLELGVAGAAAARVGRATCGHGGPAFTALLTSPVELSQPSLAGASIRSLAAAAEIASVQLNYMSHEDAGVRAAKSITLCPIGGSGNGNRLAPDDGSCSSSC